MLVPHRRENAQFSEIRGAAHNIQDHFIFVWADAMGGNDVGRNVNFGHMGSRRLSLILS